MQKANRVEEEFRKALSLLKDCNGAVLAVSGGPDSMAMLALFIKERDGGRLPFPIVCATLDHGLREESAEELRGVGLYCAEHKVPFRAAVANVREDLPKGESTESYARHVRYSFLEKVKADCGYSHLVTAHNADDNFETVVLNVVRGCGIDGLCGISRLRKDNNTFRPLLNLEKQELTDYCDQNGIPYYIDRSNFDTVYRRNFIRNKISPLFKELNPSLSDAVSRLCAAAEEDCAYLEGEADRAYGRAVSEKGLSLPAIRKLPSAILVRTLRRFAREITGQTPTFSDTEELKALVLQGKTSHKRQINGVTFILTYTHLCKEEAKEESAFTPFVPENESYLLPEGRLTFTLGESYSGQRNCFKVIPMAEASVRTRVEGDYMRTPQGSGKLLKKLYIDKKIPRHIRQTLPILTLNGQIVWAAGIGTAKEFIPQKGDKYIQAEYIPNRREE